MLNHASLIYKKPLKTYPGYFSPDVNCLDFQRLWKQLLGEIGNLGIRGKALSLLKY